MHAGCIHEDAVTCEVWSDVYLDYFCDAQATSRVKSVTMVTTVSSVKLISITGTKFKIMCIYHAHSKFSRVYEFYGFQDHIWFM